MNCIQLIYFDYTNKNSAVSTQLPKNIKNGQEKLSKHLSYQKYCNSKTVK